MRQVNGEGEDAQEPEQDDQRHDADEQLDRCRSQLGDDNDEHGGDPKHDEAPFAPGTPSAPASCASCPIGPHRSDPTAGLCHGRRRPGGMGQPESLHWAVPVVQTGHRGMVSASTRVQTPQVGQASSRPTTLPRGPDAVAVWPQRRRTANGPGRLARTPTGANTGATGGTLAGRSEDDAAQRSTKVSRTARSGRPGRVGVD